MLRKIKRSPNSAPVMNSQGNGKEALSSSTTGTIPPFMFDHGITINGSEGEFNDIRPGNGTMMTSEDNPRSNLDFAGSAITGAEDWISVDQIRLFPSGTAFDVAASGGMVPSGAETTLHTGGGGLNGVVDMDVTADINWRLWDSQVQNMGMHEEWMGDGQGF